LSHFDDCIKAFLKLSKSDQALIHEVVVGVTNGMEMDLNMFEDNEETLLALDDNAQLERLAEPLKNNGYGQYLLSLLEND